MDGKFSHIGGQVSGMAIKLRDVTMHADTTTATKPSEHDPPVLSGGITPAKKTPAEEMPRRGLVAGGSLEEPSQKPNAERRRALKLLAKSVHGATEAQNFA
jgi:hypothetical protein